MLKKVMGMQIDKQKRLNFFVNSKTKFQLLATPIKGE